MEEQNLTFVLDETLVIFMWNLEGPSVLIIKRLLSMIEGY